MHTFTNLVALHDVDDFVRVLNKFRIHRRLIVECYCICTCDGRHRRPSPIGGASAAAAITFYYKAIGNEAANLK